MQCSQERQRLTVNQLEWRHVMVFMNALPCHAIQTAWNDEVLYPHLHSNVTKSEVILCFETPLINETEKKNI